MIKGNLSRRPAPYIYIDGESLFEKTWFGVTPKRKYVDKLVKLMAEINVVIVLFKGGRVSKRAVEKSPFTYMDILEMSKDKFIKYLHRKQNTAILISEERVEEFAGISIWSYLDYSVDTILGALGL